MDKVSDFTGFNVYLGTLGEIYQEWSGTEKLVFALGEEPVDVIGVPTSVRLIAGDERGGCVRLGHRWSDELHCDQNQFGFRWRYRCKLVRVSQCFKAAGTDCSRVFKIKF